MSIKHQLYIIIVVISRYSGTKMNICVLVEHQISTHTKAKKNNPPIESHIYWKTQQILYFFRTMCLLLKIFWFAY